MPSTSLMPSHAEQHHHRARLMASELTTTLEMLPGVVTARVHLHLADRSIMSTDRAAQTSCAVVIRHRSQIRPDESQIRSVALAAVPGLDALNLKLILTPQTAPPVQIEPVGFIEVSSSTAGLARLSYGTLLVVNAILALGLIYLGIKRRRQPSRHPKA